MSKRIVWQGLQEFVVAIKDEPSMDVADKVMSESSEVCKAEAERLVPVDTGVLKGSSYKRKIKKLDYAIGFLAPYAGFVEFGTSKMGPQPYLRPAMETAMNYIKDKLPRELESKVRS